MKNYFLLLVFLFVSVSSLFAVPAVPWAVEKVQPDGTIISVYLKGDEKVNWMESEDGYTLMYDDQKYVVYAQTDGQGNLTPSNIRFGSSVKPAVNIAKGLRYSKMQVNTLIQIWEMTENAVIQRGSTGNVNMLCILAAFSDRAFVKTQSDFNNLMNQVNYNTGGAKGSVKDYFLESSYGALNLQVTVIGPVTLPNTSAYYAPGGRYREFANAVVNLADPLVDFSLFASGGEVENFHIIFAGFGDEAVDNGQQIWSHKGTLGSTVTKDGVKLSSYSCSPELRGSSGLNITYIGVVAHEMCHGLGSPDYYDIDYSGYTGSGDWDLMASGSWNDDGRQPASINPYQKIQFGWLTPQTIAAESLVSNMPASANNPIVYKIVANSNGEHYLLENRQLVGFDASLPGHGLLIWHIAANVLSAPNDNHPQQVYPVCASSTTAIPTNTPSSYGTINSAGCPFPGTSGKTNFIGTSTPQAFTWASLASLGNLVTNISENANQTISFSPLLSISGPTHFCSTGTFAISPALPNGFTVQWTVKRSREPSMMEPQGSLIVTTTTYNTPSITLYTTIYLPEFIELTAVLKDQNGAVLSTSYYQATSGALSPFIGTLWWNYNLQSGEIPIMSNNTLYLTPNEWASLTLVYTDKADNYWPAAPILSASYSEDLYNTSYSPGWISFQASNYESTGYLSIYLHDGCTMNNNPFILPVVVSSYSPSAPKAYPNPVDDILTVEIDAQDTQQQDKIANITYDIRLYDVFGTLRRQTATKNNSTQINVSDLPNGFYYLHIYDGVSDKPDMRTIVVKH